MLDPKDPAHSAALSAFGLAHGTPRPPPSWAQDWLKHPHERETRTLTIPSMLEKKADLSHLMSQGAELWNSGGSDILHGVASTLGLHTAANAVQMGLRKHAPRLGETHFNLGLTHGLEGRELHPSISSGVTLGLGPEALQNYRAGQAAAKEMHGLPAEHRSLALKTIARGVNESAHLKAAPSANSVAGGITQHLKGEAPTRYSKMLKHLPTVTPGQKIPLWQKALTPIAATGAAIAMPHMALNAAWNGAKHMFAESGPGRRLAQRQLEAGARGAAVNPKTKGLRDLFISPAFSDAQTLGHSLHQEYEHAGKKMDAYAKYHDLPTINGQVPRPGAGQLVDSLKGTHARLQEMKAPVTPAPAAKPAPAPAPAGRSGALTKGLLLGGGLLAARNALQSNRDEERTRGY